MAVAGDGYGVDSVVEFAVHIDEVLYRPVRVLVQLVNIPQGLGNVDKG